MPIYSQLCIKVEEEKEKEEKEKEEEEDGPMDGPQMDGRTKHRIELRVRN